MIKYKARFLTFPEINKVEIIRETEKQVFYSGSRENKESSWYFYGNTYNEAKNWLLTKILESKVLLETEILYKQKQIKDKDKLFSEVFDWEEK